MTTIFFRSMYNNKQLLDEVVVIGFLAWESASVKTWEILWLPDLLQGITLRDVNSGQNLGPTISF